MKAGSTRTPNIEAIYPVTPVQAGMLYHTLLAEKPGMYIMQFSCRIKGPLEISTFKQAWEATVSRHQALRSLVLWEGRETPLMLVREVVRLPWTVEDLRSEPAERQQQLVRAYLDRDRTEPFQLDSAPLMRLAVFIEGSDSATFVWSHHHLILDGWSLNIVLGEVLRDYELLRSGGSPSRDPAPPFQVFASHLREQDKEGARSHWTRYLTGFAQPNRLFEAGVDGSQWSAGQDAVSGSLTVEGSKRITEFARGHEITLDTISRAAWAIVLARYSGDHEVVFGSVVSGRPPEMTRSLEIVGPFLNTIPVRVHVEPGRPVFDLLEDLGRGRVQQAPFEWAPMADIQEWSEVPAGTPLFSALLVTQNLPTFAPSGDLTIGDARYDQPNNYPLALVAFPGDRLELTLQYDPERIDPERARSLLDHFKRVVTSMPAGADGTVGELAFFSQDELQRIIEGGHGRPMTPTHETVVEVIGAAADRSPRAIAVAASGSTTTYGELIERSRLLARQLLVAGVVPGDPVGIVMERSTGMIVAILGVLLSGGAYVPLDPRAPLSRSRSLLAHSGCRVVIADAAAPAHADVVTIGLDLRGEVVGDPFQADPQAKLPLPAPGQLAYVIYTSGSTGEPKGVAVEHSALARSTAARSLAYDDDPSGFLLVSPYFFDSSVAGIFWTLTTGGTLVLPDPDGEQDVGRLAELISEHEVSHLLTLPVVYRLLVETSPVGNLSSLRLAIVAGEVCGPDLASLHHRRLPRVRLVNEYGPTEATVWSTYHEVLPEDGKAVRVPIGGPIPGASVLILDSDLRPTPVGVEGELAIAGHNLARGYLARPELTGESFVTADLPLFGPTRIYRTGDRARWLEPGVVDLVGRLDRQVKIRGRRIEPGEIERVLEGHPRIRTAAVEVMEGQAGDSQLAGFFEPATDAAPSEDEVRRYLSSKLPSYLVPTHLVGMEALPVRPNGKIDRSRLRIPDRVDSAPPSRPMTESEVLVVGIARELVGHEGVDSDDNFFEVGGHSLLSMHLVARVFSETGFRMSPNVLLFNSLGYAAALIDRRGEDAPSPKAAAVEPSTKSRVDKPMWFGEEGELFGILHTPAGPRSDGDQVVVICPPYGWEYYKSHRALRGLARLLWDHLPVFRFDYRGTGDSKGDPRAHDLAAWVDDVRTAVGQARIRTGAEKVVLVGLRLGASLAILAADKPGTCDRLILWDPVLNGANHLLALQEMHSELYSRLSRKAARKYSGDELLGSPYPPRLRADLEDLDVTDPSTLPDVEIDIVSSNHREEYDGLATIGVSHLRVETVEDAGSWDDLTTYRTAFLPGPLPRRIAALLGPPA